MDASGRHTFPLSDQGKDGGERTGTWRPTSGRPDRRKSQSRSTSRGRTRRLPEEESDVGSRSLTEDWEHIKTTESQGRHGGDWDSHSMLEK